MQNPAIAAYAASRPQGNDVVSQYACLVQRIARHLLGRLPSGVQLDDLLQAGMLGLLEAAARYEGGRGASFETYAGIRIRGAMLDEVRRGDWAPRSVHRNARRVADAVREAEARSGRPAQDRDIAAALDVSLEDYHRMLDEAAGARLFSLDALMETDDGIEPAAAHEPGAGVENQAFKRELAEAIGELPEREQLVLSLYYDEELNLKEIGAVIGVSESRVSQIMTQANLRLRARLAAWRED